MAGKSSKSKPNAASVSGRSQLVELTKEPWKATVNLRGSIELSEYNRYVIPISFPRFLSARYEREKELSAEEIERICAVSRHLRRTGAPDDFLRLKFVAPPEVLRRAFAAVTSSWCAASDKARAQSRALAKTRDALLPVLLSGERGAAT